MTLEQQIIDAEAMIDFRLSKLVHHIHLKFPALSVERVMSILLKSLAEGYEACDEQR